MKRFKFALLALGLSTQVMAHPFKLLETITNLTAPSAFEAPVSKVLKQAWSPYLKELHQDGMGNLIGANKSQGKNKILLMSHMDEVGFIISHIEDNGLLRVQPLGGINDNVVMAQRYNIMTPKGKVLAYSGFEAVHIIPQENREKLVKKQDMFLDIGATSKQEVIDGFQITPGMPVAPASEFTQLSKNRYLAKALDDRIGLSLLSDLMKESLNTPNKIIYAATTQEEVGLRGAKTIYPITKPDVVFNIEIGIANDFPLRLGKKYDDIALGKGPTIFIYDGSMLPNQKLVSWVKSIAKGANIPIQYEVEPGYGEDGASIQTRGQGVATINIGIPVRYAHQHAGIFDATDYQQALKLLTVLVEKFDKKAIS